MTYEEYEDHLEALLELQGSYELRKAEIEYKIRVIKERIKELDDKNQDHFQTWYWKMEPCPEPEF